MRIDLLFPRLPTELDRIDGYTALLAYHRGKHDAAKPFTFLQPEDIPVTFEVQVQSGKQAAYKGQKTSPSCLISRRYPEMLLKLSVS